MNKGKSERYVVIINGEKVSSYLSRVSESEYETLGVKYSRTIKSFETYIGV
ncbi:hypothetical protein N8D25_13830 (plasmid) [Enterococcus faecium]